jgi:hypothetical protein
MFDQGGFMKRLKKILALLVLSTLLLAPTLAVAADFDWTKDLNLRAEADPSGFRAQLSTRFKIGDAQVKVVLGKVDRPSDAYMLFRLGELSSRPVNYVLDKYRTGPKKGWGAFAKSLGIKPGSKEFHALKQGDNLYGGQSKGKKKNKNKGKGKG